MESNQLNGSVDALAQALRDVIRDAVTGAGLGWRPKRMWLGQYRVLGARWPRWRSGYSIRWLRIRLTMKPGFGTWMRKSPGWMSGWAGWKRAWITLKPGWVISKQI